MANDRWRRRRREKNGRRSSAGYQYAIHRSIARTVRPSVRSVHSTRRKMKRSRVMRCSSGNLIISRESDSCRASFPLLLLISCQCEIYDSIGQNFFASLLLIAFHGSIRDREIFKRPEEGRDAAKYREIGESLDTFSKSTSAIAAPF